MKSTTIRTIALVALLSFAPSIFAATYQYVDTSGNMKTIIADNPQMALANAVNIAPHSGVISTTIVSSTPVTVVVTPTTTTAVVLGICNSNIYNYVDTSGTLQSVTASSASVALSNAINIAPHSGVIQSCNI
ncbi:hypothetical protein H0W91_02235 [Patescibacteria group bacterium]|nr:hypothetical protein [Patescibacteria group bacterium]